MWEFQFLKNTLFFPKSVFPNLHYPRYDLETLGKSSSFPDLHLLIESSCYHFSPILSTHRLYIHPISYSLFCFLFLNLINHELSTKLWRHHHTVCYLGWVTVDPLQCSCLENPPWRGEPGRLPSMGSHRVGHDWSDLAAAAAAAATDILHVGYTTYTDILSMLESLLRVSGRRVRGRS